MGNDRTEQVIEKTKTLVKESVDKIVASHDQIAKARTQAKRVIDFKEKFLTPGKSNR